MEVIVSMSKEEALAWLEEHIQWYENEYRASNPNNEQVQVYKISADAIRRVLNENNS